MTLDIPFEKVLVGLKQYLDCALCCNNLANPMETPCGHVFCADCINQVCRSAGVKAACPLCKRYISRRSLVERSDVRDINALIRRLNNSFDEELHRHLSVDAEMKKATDQQGFATPASLTVSGQVKVSEIACQPETFRETDCHASIAESKKQVVQKGSVSVGTKTTPQAYIILSASAVPLHESDQLGKTDSVLDLSMPRNSPPITYVYQSAIKYVKPLDLSTNSGSRIPVPKRLADSASHDEGRAADKKARFDLKVSVPNEVGIGSPHKEGVDGEKSGRVSKSNSLFKHPSPLTPVTPHVSRGSTIRTGTDDKKNEEEIKEDDFQIPRDSDLLFLALNDSGNPAPVPDPPQSSDLLMLNLNDDGNLRDSTEQEQARDSDLLFLNLNDSGHLNNIAEQPLEGESRSSPVCKLNLQKGDTEDKVPTIRSFVSNRENGRQLTNQMRANLIKEFMEKNNLTAGDDDDPFEDANGDGDSELREVVNFRPASQFRDSTMTAPTRKLSVKDATNSSPVATTKYVFCPTRLNKTQTMKLQELCNMCNGSISKDFTGQVTHLVINLANGRVPQTLKYLLAIAGRKWVVIYDWVEKCLDAGSLISEEQYETSNYRQCDPGVKRSRLATSPLFHNFKFYFATDHFKQMGYSFEEVMALMTSLGAQVVPSLDDVEEPRELIIIGDPGGNSEDYKNWLVRKHWITVTFSWIIECVLEYRLVPFTRNHLCTEAYIPELESARVPSPLQHCISQYISQKSRNR